MYKLKINYKKFQLKQINNNNLTFNVVHTFFKTNANNTTVYKMLFIIKVLPHF